MQELFELGTPSFEHAVCNSVIPRRLIRVQFLDFTFEFLRVDVLVEERVYSRESGVLHFV